MSKRSTATLRARPVAATTSVSGPLAVRSETLTIESASRLQVIDVTDRVMALVHRLGVSEGLVSVVSLHTTCTVFVNEYQAALVADITRYLDDAVAPGGGWMHDNPDHSDCDRGNADAHLRALMLGHGLSLQVSGGEVVLGQWQRILMAELDGPRTRTMRVMVMGVA